jgi:hypothetical protein
LELLLFHGLLLEKPHGAPSAQELYGLLLADIQIFLNERGSLNRNTCMGKGAVRADGYAVPAVIAQFIPDTDHDRKAVPVLELEDGHGTLGHADSVLFAFVLIDSQKSHE